MTSTLRTVTIWAILATVSLACAGCDKCGNKVRLNVPSIQNSCAGDIPSSK